MIHDSTATGGRACCKCKVVQPIERFSFSNRSTGKRQIQCKKCAAGNSERWRQANLTLSLDQRRQRLYSLTPEAYGRLLAQQEGVCAICQMPETMRLSLSVDHDHRCCNDKGSCGRCVRGLVCHRCNRGLAAFRDDPALALRAALYLVERGAPAPEEEGD